MTCSGCPRPRCTPHRRDICTRSICSALATGASPTGYVLRVELGELDLQRPWRDLEYEPFARVEIERLEELRLTAGEDRFGSSHRPLQPRFKLVAAPLTAALALAAAPAVARALAAPDPGSTANAKSTATGATHALPLHSPSQPPKTTH